MNNHKLFVPEGKFVPHFLRMNTVLLYAEKEIKLLIVLQTTVSCDMIGLLSIPFDIIWNSLY